MSNKIWFITGVSSGLGKALTEFVIDQGHYVIATFRKDSQIEEFNRKYKNQAKAVKLDLSHTQEIEKTVDTIAKEVGSIDVLVNNAGLGITGAVEETSLKEVRQIFEVNVFGTFQLTKCVLPHMRKKGRGHIVQISSHAGLVSFAGFGIYNASKYALEGFSEALALEVKPLGIDLTIVEPGPFRTNFAGRSLIHVKEEIIDYKETAGAFRKKLVNVHNKQEGDPVKAAKIIFNKVENNNGTLRLPLGTVPLKTIKIKINNLQSDLETNRKYSKNAVY